MILRHTIIFIEYLNGQLTVGRVYCRGFEQNLEKKSRSFIWFNRFFGFSMDKMYKTDIYIHLVYVRVKIFRRIYWYNAWSKVKMLHLVMHFKHKTGASLKGGM